MAGVVGRGRVVALDHKDVWKTWFWGLGCLMGIKEWRLEDANRWCGVAVPRLPDASLCSCHISTGLKARGYSFSRLPDGFSLTAHHNDSEPLLVPVLGEILKRVQDDDWRIRSSLTAHCSSLTTHSSKSHFADKVGCVSPFLYEEQNKADIYTDAALKVAVETDVATHGLPVAVEGQSDEFAASVEHGAAGVSAGDIVVADEAELHLAGVLVGISSPFALLHQRHDVVFQLVVLNFLLLCGFVQQALCIGEVVKLLATRSVVLDETVAQAHGEIGVAVVRVFLIHLQQRLGEQMLVKGDDTSLLAHALLYLHELVGDNLAQFEGGVCFA